MACSSRLALILRVSSTWCGITNARLMPFPHAYPSQTLPVLHPPHAVPVPACGEVSNDYCISCGTGAQRFTCVAGNGTRCTVRKPPCTGRSRVCPKQQSMQPMNTCTVPDMHAWEGKQLLYSAGTCLPAWRI